MRQSAYSKYRNKVLREIRKQKNLGLDVDIELPLTERQLRKQGVQGAELRKHTVALKKTLPSLKGQTAEVKNIIRSTRQKLELEQSHTDVSQPEEPIRHPRIRQPKEELEKTSARRSLSEAQRQAISERVKAEWASDKRQGHKRSETEKERFKKMAQERAEVLHEVAEIEREKREEQEALRKELEQQDIEERERYRKEQEEYYSDIFGEIQEQENKRARSERSKQAWQRRKERRQTREEIEQNILNNTQFIADEDQRYYDIFYDWFSKISQPFPDVPRFNFAREIQQVLLDTVTELVEEIGEDGVGYRLWANLGEARLSELTEIIIEPSDQTPERIIASNEIISALTNQTEVTEEQASALSDYNDMLMFSQLPLL